jgi:hypothetical protein
MSETFESVLDEDKELLESAIVKLRNVKPRHFVGLDCWCYEDKGTWLQSIQIDGAIYGAIWSDDGSIFCWLCMIDEVDHGAPLHDTVAPMYTNDEFIHHIRFDHWPMSKYLPRLPNGRGQRE